MSYLISHAKFPIQCIACGNLVNDLSFTHMKRTLDCFLIILIQKGTLHISQGGRNYDVKENEFILITADHEHFGYKSSDGYLSYYWAHFYITDPNYRYCNKLFLSTDYYTIPQYFSFSKSKRTNLLFVQLLDLARSENFIYSHRCHYALSLLILEISHELARTQRLSSDNIPFNIIPIIEWVLANYNLPLTVQGIAEKFNYNATYLSSLFKKYTGYPLLNYINRTRISAAKNLLTNRKNTLSFIAETCGFNDEKYFMKLFKSFEGMTPTQYRNAFYKKRINKD